MRCCWSGISASKPIIKRLAISRKNTPDLLTGSRKVVDLSLNNATGSISKISPTNLGGVKTSSLLKLARQDKTSGL